MWNISNINQQYFWAPMKACLFYIFKSITLYSAMNCYRVHLFFAWHYATLDQFCSLLYNPDLSRHTKWNVTKQVLEVSYILPHAYLHNVTHPCKTHYVHILRHRLFICGAMFTTEWQTHWVIVTYWFIVNLLLSCHLQCASPHVKPRCRVVP